MTRLSPRHVAPLSAIVAALLAIALFPSDALAWTPGTHVYIGDAVLRSLSMLPSHIAGLLGAFPYDFLYGSIAADTSIAKKYAAVGRHSHSWTVGFDILDRARDDALRAFSYGYLAHLAADVVAHNVFVPYQLAVTSSTTGFGHSYWETRFETHLGEWAPRRARELIVLDHSRSDAHLDRILSPTIFSTSTNRRIFRGMVVAADMESWQRVFQLMLERSRWDLADDLVAVQVTTSFDYVMDLLRRLDSSDAMRFDPSGHDRLRMAKRIRRTHLRAGGEEAVAEQAAQEFALPPASEPMSLQLGWPLFPPRPEKLPFPARSA
ncbi:MAG TPA: zinc dependent phospholipase C family protein [Gemmatimonadaceae bacterium]|nr:zinc dependent phospholipase C family protein [Gemmatimonadaceae bacterium]